MPSLTTKKISIKIAIFLQKYVLISFTIIVFGLIAACSKDADKQEISQKIRRPAMNAVVNTHKKTEYVDQTIKENITKSLTTEEVIKFQKDGPVNNLGTKNPIDVEEKITQLQVSLNDNNQNNATLRQQMKVLLKKVKENQTEIEDFKQPDSNLPQK